MFRLLAAVLLLVCASPIHSATSFEVDIESNSRFTSFRKATVTTDGPKIHIGLGTVRDEVSSFHSAVSRSGPRGFIGINADNETWYDLEGASPLTMRSHLLSAVSKDTKVEKIKVAFGREPSHDAEMNSHRYVVRVSYETADVFEGHKIRVSRGVTALITTNPRLSEIAWPADMIFSTGIPRVDESIRERMSVIEGLPVSIELAFARTYHGGSPTTESVKVNVRDIREVVVDPELFETPSGYRNQKPVIGVPGR